MQTNHFIHVRMPASFDEEPGVMKKDLLSRLSPTLSGSWSRHPIWAGHDETAHFISSE
jgi:hypothetical protein